MISGEKLRLGILLILVRLACIFGVVFTSKLFHESDGVYKFLAIAMVIVFLRLYAWAISKEDD